MEEVEEKASSTVLRLGLSCVVWVCLFVPLWAGFNFGFGSALEGPIGAFDMEGPCQRLARTREPLSRYSLAGKGRHSTSVCHFASRPVHVQGKKDGLGFTGHELGYLVIGFVGYTACFAGALVLSAWIVRAGSRLLGARRE